MTINNKVRENVRPSMKRLAESTGGSRVSGPSPDADANATAAEAFQQQRF
jgi:hypothetical protein